MTKKEEKKFEHFLDEFKTLVTKKGFKNTVQKDCILKILYFSNEHLSAEAITKKVQKEFDLDIGIATVYRSLNFFEQMNIVESLDVGDNTKRFEFKQEQHHDHMICTNCHKIIEFSDDFIELNQIKIAEKNGFILEDHIMTIYGICENCQ
ncbi:Fur family transcriptional regulator [Halarcobacter sp.]|uniref:Fur family transcriptional regulator n=1 Tax=Halarcobacter sp. TaxID=2321133 RepID=UPI002AAAB67F|nr:Fur family transcriptional regulator [Halarcobacter sp.]